MVDYIETLIYRRMAEIEQQEEGERREFEAELLLTLTDLYRDGIVEACVGEDGRLMWGLADLPFVTIEGEQN